MKTLLLIDDSGSPHGQAVVRRRYPPRIAALLRLDVQPVLVTLRGERQLHNELRTDLGVSSYALGFSGGRDSLRTLRRFSQIVASENPDLVQAHEVVPALFAGIALLFRRQQPVLYSRHHTTGGWKLNAGSRAAARVCSGTVVASQAVLACARRIDHTPARKVHIVGSGVADLRRVSEEEIRDLRGDLSIPEEAAVVGTLARLRHEKGLDVLIDAMDELQRLAEREVHVVIVGEGPERALLQRRSESDRLHLVGHRDDIAPWYALMDVVAMPSRREALGQVTAEAMAAGKPLVVSSVGGLPEAVLDGVNALLVPPDEPHSLAQALARVLRDTKTAGSMGRASRRRYEEIFTMERAVEREVACWTRILDGAAMRFGGNG